MHRLLTLCTVNTSLEHGVADDKIIFCSYRSCYPEDRSLLRRKGCTLKLSDAIRIILLVMQIFFTLFKGWRQTPERNKYESQPLDCRLWGWCYCLRSGFYFCFITKHWKGIHERICLFSVDQLQKSWHRFAMGLERKKGRLQLRTRCQEADTYHQNAFWCSRASLIDARTSQYWSWFLEPCLTVAF